VHYVGAFLSILIVTALLAWLGAFGDTGVTSSVIAEQPSLPGPSFNESSPVSVNDTASKESTPKHNSW